VLECGSFESEISGYLLSCIRAQGIGRAIRKETRMSVEETIAPIAPDPWPSSSGVRIRDVRVIRTAPEGIRLVIVKIETTEPELYGVGCASFTTRAEAVATVIEQYLRPLLIGRDPHDIEDIFQTGHLSSYWRSGPILNNALSGVDQALWDIKGKLARMPLYQLFGGKTRKAATVYTHASGADLQDVEEQVRKLMEQGFTHIRCQVNVPGYATYGAFSPEQQQEAAESFGPHDYRHWYNMSPVQGPWNEAAYVRIVPKLFEHIRSTIGDEVELLHDVHERVQPILAINLARELEQYRLFFLEDPFAPEDAHWFERMREATPIPIAMGELFVNPSEWEPLIRERLIDFIRVHISAIGGLTPARKLAIFCEWLGIRTAWHGPGDVSPIGHAANLHLDLASTNFGIQEAFLFGPVAQAVFPGTPDIRDGMMWSNERPGLGIDIDEALAAKHPYPDYPLNGSFPPHRRIDGSVIRW
jgi:mannonate dehydratase